MPAGRPTKPTALKVLEGTVRKDRIKNEPKPKPIAPPAPNWLDTDAKKEWKRLAPELEKLGLLTVADLGAFASYCSAYSSLGQAQKALTAYQKKNKKLTYTTDQGQIKPIPELAMSAKAKQEIKAFCIEFGLSPSSRGRMNLPEQKTENAFSDFMNKKKRDNHG